MTHTATAVAIYYTSLTGLLAYLIRQLFFLHSPTKKPERKSREPILIKERDALIKERDALIKERDDFKNFADDLFEEKYALIKERDALVKTKATLTKEYAKKMDALIKERDRLSRESASRKTEQMELRNQLFDYVSAVSKIEDYRWDIQRIASQVRILGEVIGDLPHCAVEVTRDGQDISIEFGEEENDAE